MKPSLTIATAIIVLLATELPSVRCQLGRAGFETVLRSIGSGGLMIVSTYGKCWWAEGGGLIGSRISFWDCNFRGDFTPQPERYIVTSPDSDGDVKIKVTTGSLLNRRRCVYVGNDFGDPLYVTDCDEYKSWFKPIMLSNGKFLIKHVSSGRCLDANERGNGGSIVAYNCNENDPEQQWEFCGTNGC
jgi:Ricin-type beta-trefoil lectin domain